MQTVPRCDTHARTFTHNLQRNKHAHAKTPLFSLSPVAMEPVAKAERYLVVMEAADEARVGGYINEAGFDGGHKEDNRD